jgi:hypothetical protein
MDLFRQIAGRPCGDQLKADIPEKRGIKSVAVTFRNFLIARIALLTICAMALASCETDTTGPTAGVRPNADAPRPQAGPVTNSEPMTHSRAARECWMRTEKGSAHENLDKRAELVNKCIDEKMKAAGAPSPRT